MAQIEKPVPYSWDRAFTVSRLIKSQFNYLRLERVSMKPLIDYTENDVDDSYSVTQQSVLACISDRGVRRTTVIDKYGYAITTRPDRTPAQVTALGGGRYRYLTERECWRLQGFTDANFDVAMLLILAIIVVMHVVHKEVVM